MNLRTVDAEQASEDLRREVAQLRRVVRSLRGSEERLRMIIDAEPECVKMLGPDGVLLEMNPAGLRMVEADSLEQLRNQCVYSLVVPEHRAAFRDLTERVFQGESGILHFQIVGLKGGRRWLETHASPLHDSSGKVNVLLSITRDITEQKEAEEKLRASEQRLMSIYNTVADVIFHLVVEGEDSYRFASINPAFSRVTGVPAEAVVGKNIAAIIPESSLGLVLQNYRKAIEEKTIVRWEETSDYAAGSLVGEVSVAPVFDEAGRCTHLVGSVHDITDRKRVEEALRESETHLRLALEAAGMGTFDWDIAQNKVIWSRRHEMIFGYRPGEFDGSPQAFEERLHPDDRAAVRANIERSIAERKPLMNEFRVVWPDGSVRWVHARGEITLAENGQPVRVRGVAMDVTAGRLADQALRQSHQRLTDILDSMFAFVGLFSTDGVLIEANRAPFEATGLSREEAIGKPLAETFSFNYSAETQERLRAAFERAARGEIVRYDEGVRIRGGAIITMDVILSPLRDAQGTITQIVGSAVDITDRKRVEKELMESQRQLRSLAARLRKVREEEAIRISREIHDQLGQALTGLRMDVEMLQNFCRAGTPPSARAEAEHRLKKMTTAIDDTISLARRVSAELRPPLLDALGLSAALEWEAREFEARSSIFCNISLPADEPRISREYATVVFRIFQELLTNIARHAQASEISIAFVANEVEAVLTVQDDGVGFDPKGARPGGLGMIGMHERARACGLTFKVKSIPGEGTTAVVRIPASACL